MYIYIYTYTYIYNQFGVGKICSHCRSFWLNFRMWLVPFCIEFYLTYDRPLQWLFQTAWMAAGVKYLLGKWAPTVVAAKRI